MSIRVSFELPEDAAAAFGRHSDEVTRQLRLAAAAKWYELGLVSQERAAQVAGLSREEFLLSLGKFGVSPYQLSAEDLHRELRA